MLVLFMSDCQRNFWFSGEKCRASKTLSSLDNEGENWQNSFVNFISSNSDFLQGR